MENNTTVVERVDNATVGKWHYECMWDGKTLESLDVRVGARLQVEDFECRTDLYDSHNDDKLQLQHAEMATSLKRISCI
ncbi:GL18309 [Drosophila persimilis]|uniref:GL18309 n=1 Tax=Drosophila persimilis TaxID=7234 RepID=B4H4R1_DROPE|nr:GL18309 [Drosophila persimilis]